MNHDIGLGRREPRPLEAEIEAGIAPASTAAAVDQRLFEQAAGGAQIHGGGEPLDAYRQQWRPVRPVDGLEAVGRPPDQGAALGKAIDPAAEPGRQARSSSRSGRWQNGPGGPLAAGRTAARARARGSGARRAALAGRRGCCSPSSRTSGWRPARRGGLRQKLEPGRQQRRGRHGRQIGDRDDRLEPAGPAAGQQGNAPASRASSRSSGRSTWPRRCSQSTTTQHSTAQLAPSAQPASTSLGQCTPR